VCGPKRSRVDFDSGKLSSHLVVTSIKGESHIVGCFKRYTKTLVLAEINLGTQILSFVLYFVPT